MIAAGMACGLDGFVGANLSPGGDRGCRLGWDAWHWPGLFLAAASGRRRLTGKAKAPGQPSRNAPAAANSMRRKMCHLAATDATGFV